MLQCPVCGGRDFRDYKGRPNAHCVGCATPERARALWMIIQRLQILREGMKVLHLAPELGLARKFYSLYGVDYHPCDSEPHRYRHYGIPIFELDLCRSLAKLPNNAFDLVIHNHVLEHIPCAIEPVLREFSRVMRPGGHHFFSVPIQGRRTVEDLSATLPPEERLARFLQKDHMRLFGSDDLLTLLRRIWGREEVHVDVLKLFTEVELERAAIQAPAPGHIDGHTIFHMKL